MCWPGCLEYDAGELLPSLLAVSDSLDTDLFLKLDDMFDGVVLEILEVLLGTKIVFQGLTLLEESSGPEQRTNMLSTERRREVERSRRGHCLGFGLRTHNIMFFYTW